MEAISNASNFVKATAHMFTKTRVKTSDILTRTVHVASRWQYHVYLSELNVPHHRYCTICMYSYGRSKYDNSGFCILDLYAVWFGRKLQKLPHLQDR